MELASSLSSHQEYRPNYPSACSRGGRTQGRGGQMHSVPLVCSAGKKKKKKRFRLLSGEMRANSQVLIEVWLQMGLVNFPPLGHAVTRGMGLYMSDKCVWLNVCAAIVCVDPVIWVRSFLRRSGGAQRLKRQSSAGCLRSAWPRLWLKMLMFLFLCFDVGRTMAATMVGGRYRETL